MKKLSAILRVPARWLVRGACACSCLLPLSCAFGDADAVRSLFEDNEDPLVVAVGSDTFGEYAVFSSPTGTEWTGNLVPVAEPGTLQFAMHGGGLLLAAGNAPNYYLSGDGLLWGKGNTGGGASAPAVLYDGVYASGRYVVVGNNTDGEAMAFTSVDGVYWAGSNLDNMFSGSLYGVAYGGGMFVAVGVAAGFNSFIVASADGMVWTGNLMQGATLPVDLYDVVYGNGVFVAVGSGGRATASPNGLSWSGTFTIGADLLNINGITFGGDRFVAVGNVTGLGTSGVYLSKDGLVWSNNVNSDMSVSCDFQDVTYCHGYFIAVTSCGSAAYSPLGLSWNNQSVPGGGSLYGVTCRP